MVESTEIWGRYVEAPCSIKFVNSNISSKLAIFIYYELTRRRYCSRYSFQRPERNYFLHLQAVCGADQLQCGDDGWQPAGRGGHFPGDGGHLYRPGSER